MKALINQIVIIFVLIGTCSCGQVKENQHKDNIPDSTRGLSTKKPPSSFTDTLFITGFSAVFYNPDSLQLEKIKAANPNNVFESMVHDCYFQMRNARMVLKKHWPSVKIIETSRNRFLSFIKDKELGSSTVDLNTNGDMCGLYLFNGTKAPLVIDMTNIETGLADYFK